MSAERILLPRVIRQDTDVNFIDTCMNKGSPRVVRFPPPAEGRSARTRAETHSLRVQGGMDFTYQRQPPPRDQSQRRSVDQSQPSTISGPSGNERDDGDVQEKGLRRRSAPETGRYLVEDVLTFT